MPKRSRRERIAAVASILDPTRERLHAIVRSSDHPLGVDEAALAAGIPRTTAALHLDRLVRTGVLEVELRRRSGRTGPGAGRPAKLYRASGRDDVVGVSERDYGLIGDILASGIDESIATGSLVGDTVTAIARLRGSEFGRGRDLVDALTEAGYAPHSTGSDSVALENCPFRQLAVDHTELVCSANLAMLEGLLEECGDGSLRAIRVEGECCVMLAQQSDEGGNPPSRATLPNNSQATPS